MFAKIVFDSAGRRAAPQKKRKTRKSRKAKSKHRRRVKFSNVVQTICPTDNSETDDSSSDDGNDASGEDNGEPATQGTGKMSILR